MVGIVNFFKSETLRLRDVANFPFHIIQIWNRLKILSKAAMGKTGKKCLFFNYLSTLLHAASLVFSLWKWSTIKITHTLIGLWSRPRINPPPTHLVSGRATVNVDGGVEDITWIRGLGGEKSPAASYALLLNLLKKVLLLPSENDRVLSPVFHSAATKCVCARRLADSGHLSPAVSRTLLSVVQR